MFRGLLSVFAKETAVDRAFAELNEMLEKGAWMFERANDVLHNRISAEQASEQLYTRDQQINDLERSIRRKILRHLTVNPGYDVPVCLALITVARDAERIGDYCKNVFEISCHYSEGFHVPKYHDPLEQISAQTLEIFSIVADACQNNSQEGRALETKKQTRDIQDRCDQIITEIFEDETQIEFHEAVAYTLLARHYKRVAAHLFTVASVVYGELAELDLSENDY
ncbi:phosphate transport system regulatory protein PhoU [Halorhodospira halochloris]|uniref:Phosphate transport system regulatory protein PhoU n=1 Tax=Halorhodospira halochloris TaxID=1052 RepID=A0A0X8XBF0_HALHR|nr:PhoU domain-containing protein [Halorhodospira halochloris]MBK1652774.1 PhoU family transcriptional regulator [Halorhodospira halochloris]BAU58897.1 phosphate transport system regulatory protein PhoU [Halorhodospira halochloris]